MTVDKLLVKARDLQPECFAPTDTFARIGMLPGKREEEEKKGGI